MKITAIEYEVLQLELSEPYQIAYETVSNCENVVLKIITDSGLVGHGIATPDQEITGETAADVVMAIKDHIEPTLLGEHPFRIAHWMHILKANNHIRSSAKAMVDIALHDLLARKAQLPLYQLLGGFRNSITTSITIGIKPLADTLATAEQYLSQGFHFLKLKGGLDMEEDVEKVFKLRERFGNTFTLRFDANQGYTAEQAITFVGQTEAANIEILEQPTSRASIQEIKKVTTSTDIPIMADESITSLADAIHFTKNEAIDMINIKLQKVGGILEAGHINSVGKSAGLEVMIGCLDECALGIAAGLHFALSRPNIEFADLDGHLDLLNDPFQNLFHINNGQMTPNNKIGIGL